MKQQAQKSNRQWPADSILKSSRLVYLPASPHSAAKRAPDGQAAIQKPPNNNLFPSSADVSVG
jgi:hypothetical protein